MEEPSSSSLAHGSLRTTSSNYVSSGTPRHQKSDGFNTPQNHLRSEVGNQMAPELLRCPVEVFLRYCSPFKVQERSVQSALKALRGAKLLQGNVWTKYQQQPSAIESTEASIFGHLVPIIKVLENQTCYDEKGVRRSRNFIYVETPNTALPGEHVGGGFKVDSCIFVEKSETRSLEDVAVVAEFKRNRGHADLKDNRLKVVSAANHIMNTDPCRTRMYGISIEDEHMAIWRFSRSHSLKSDAFDFTRNPELFVRALLMFLFAKKEEIGFDPTVHRIRDGDKIQYIYEINPEGSQETLYFRTIELIFNPRTLCINGRKTRVWAVRQVNGKSAKAKFLEGAPTVVLKEVWLDSTSCTELQIQEAINDRLKMLKPKDFDWAGVILKRDLIHAITDFPHNLPFMPILHGGWGQETKECPAEAERDLTILFPERDPMSPVQLGQHVTPESTQALLSASSTNAYAKSAPPQPDLHRDFAVKRQYRLIYGKVGHSLIKAKNISSSFIAIKDVFVALVLLYLAGWVHRDISAGNIILIKGKDGQIHGQLSDLEYAREYHRRDAPATDPKTGTPFFMPIEIHSGRAMKLRSAEVTASLAHASEDQDAATVLTEDNDPLFEQGPVFSYHHDLESLALWTGLWVVLEKVDYEPTKAVLHFLYTVTSDPTPDRENFFKGDKAAATLRERITKAIHPDLPGFNRVFNFIRGKLFHACTNLPDDPQEREDYYHSLYNEIHGALLVLKNTAVKATDVEFEPQHQPPVLRSRSQPVPKKNDDGADYVDGKEKAKSKEKGKEKEEAEREPSDVEFLNSRKRKISDPARLHYKNKRPT
ncbi:hypothetical protein NP233_g1092 [Leucocoprinus birnbaumii]|uniref:Fungal-type protein kinase domain-containing protein n=1 Tax=Leucocoprinus birnbaumii TaxID=56174 RepID=A0AAD5W4M4_9AGAR|nr:hypothetical protein NP233_g1092 [Leucocoprinus birnbaumii]